MVSKYVCEQKRYTQLALVNIFECDEENAVAIIKKLKEHNVVKAVKATEEQKELSDLLDEDVEAGDVIEGERKYYYVFTFVGVLVVKGIVLKCFPKYILNNAEPKEELKQILKVLEKYNSKEQIIQMFNDTNTNKTLNLLAVMLFLLHDYFENGSYTNTEDIIESNGDGEIVWEKTINETFTLISNNRPYYTDLQTKKRRNDDYDYFKRLHEAVLTIISNELMESDLLDLFEITPVDLSDEKVDDFGDNDYICYRIEKELATQFNTRKQMVLKTLYSYIRQEGSLHDGDGISLYGTNSFNLVWEEVCSAIFDNQLKKPLKDIGIRVPLADEYSANMELRDIIDHPIWRGELQGCVFDDAKDTLIPDIISLYDVGNDVRCAIIDAKYYNLRMDKNGHLQGQPGIESISKQYLYQMAYDGFLRDHAVTHFRSCFIMPTENTIVENIGEVSIGFMRKNELADIQVRRIPASHSYSLYLKNAKMDISELVL